MIKQLSLALCLVVPAFALAGGTDPHANFKQMTVQEVADGTKSGKVTAVDANDADTRAKYGTVPGALLLTSHKFDADKELPADKTSKLVFYCGNEQCLAAPGAAKRATEAGYKDVAVMPAGIMGWVKAGQPVSKPGSKKS
jgi:rhodanese-related sulfurtransferase